MAERGVRGGDEQRASVEGEGSAERRDGGADHLGEGVLDLHLADGATHPEATQCGVEEIGDALFFGHGLYLDGSFDGRFVAADVARVHVEALHIGIVWQVESARLAGGQQRLCAGAGAERGEQS